MRAFDSGYFLLHQMYQDVYYPDFLVDKIKHEIEVLIRLLETGVQDTNSIQAACDMMTCKINGLQEEFDDNDSEIETVARDAIGTDIDYILQWFEIPIDVEDAIAERDW